MSKTDMVNHICTVLGFEHPLTIYFCELMERYPHGDKKDFKVMMEGLIELAA